MCVTESPGAAGYPDAIQSHRGPGMNIQAISGSATVAIACTFVFVLAARFWQLFARSLNAHPNFPHAIMREAAQRFRDELETLSRKQSSYLGAGLMFAGITGLCALANLLARMPWNRRTASSARG